MQHARPNRLRRAIGFAALAALLGAASLTLMQCTMVGDTLVGAQLTPGKATGCVKDCENAHFLRIEQCKKDHETARENCKLLPEPDRTACLDAASAARGACQTASEGQKQECINSCHRQGAGSAG